MHLILLCGVECCFRQRNISPIQKNADLAQNITKKVHGIKDQVKHLAQLKGMLEESVPCSPEGLCSVQKSLGEEALSKTCGTFPRENVHFHNLNIRSFTTNCPEVARLTVASKEAMKLVDQPMAKKVKEVSLFSVKVLFQATKKTFFRDL